MSGRHPKKIWVDEGKEFYNKLMDESLEKRNIDRYSTHGEHKSAVVERFSRTLKEMMWRRFTAENTRISIDMIDRLLKEYNNKIHSTIGMTPTEASLKKNKLKVIQNMINKGHVGNKSTVKFKVGDRVRISRIKGIFEKGYLPNWSEAVFTVERVNETIPVTYVIKDSMGEVIKGSFYQQELQATNQEIYRIEKVIRKKKIDGVEHAFVKWSGYSDKFNQWIPLSDTQKLI